MLVHTTKYDGSLHYRFAAQDVDVADDQLALYIPAGTAMDSYRGPVTLDKPILMVQWRGRPWKLSVRWETDWSPCHYYVDICTPPDWSDGTLRLTDLDLDLILVHGRNSPVLDDADEFEDHIERFGYPPDLVADCLAATLEVAALMARKAAPFDGALYGWRPGQPLPAFESAAASGR